MITLVYLGLTRSYFLPRIAIIYASSFTLYKLLFQFAE